MWALPLLPSLAWRLISISNLSWHVGLSSRLSVTLVDVFAVISLPLKPHVFSQFLSHLAFDRDIWPNVFVLLSQFNWIRRMSHLLFTLECYLVFQSAKVWLHRCYFRFLNNLTDLKLVTQHHLFSRLTFGISKSSLYLGLASPFIDCERMLSWILNQRLDSFCCRCLWFFIRNLIEFIDLFDIVWWGNGLVQIEWGMWFFKLLFRYFLEWVVYSILTCLSCFSLLKLFPLHYLLLNLLLVFFYGLLGSLYMKFIGNCVVTFGNRPWFSLF